MKDFLKTLGIVLIIGIAGLVISYFAIPEFKTTVNENVFGIYQTVEDENKDETTGDETTGDETNGDETGEIINGMPKPQDPVEDETTTEE